MGNAPIILVPGFWLGAWAWDEVAETLRAEGHDVTPLTLPGLESRDSDRSTIKLTDHVDAICAAVEAAPAPPVLAVHSGAAVPGYGASDRVPDRLAAMVYVDTAPSGGPINGEFEGTEWAMTVEELTELENLEGISEAQLAAFRERAVPQPADAVRGTLDLTNDARLDVPSVVICTAFPSSEYKSYAEQGAPFLSGLTEVRNVTYIDLPTSHWPMWSKAGELAEIIGRVAMERGA